MVGTPINVIHTATQQTKALKIVDLLLNKIPKFNWNYFDIKLNDAKAAYNFQQELNRRTSDIIKEIDDFLDQNIQGHISGSFTITRHNRTAFDSDFLFKLIIYIEHYPAILKSVMSRIFDMNVILNGDLKTTQDARSSAHAGKMGKFNQKEKERRNKRFYKAFRKQPDFRAKPNHFVVLAEGDSWFCFPKISVFTPVKDIIDHLIDYDNINLYSLAAGGDWLFNMLDEKGQEYAEALSKICPDVFLVSGGGNDLVSNNRVAQMVRSIQYHEEPNHEVFQRLWEVRRDISDLNKAYYKRGLSLISKNFLDFINICMVQYFTLFYKLLKTTNKFSQMLILTQGYDFAIPSNDRKGSLKQKLLKNFMNNGQWLYDSLVMKGIYKLEDQKAVVYFMIYEFNEMLASLAKFVHFPNVFHIDIRGFATENDWFDELHLKSQSYEKISEVFSKTIEEYAPLLKSTVGKQQIQDRGTKVIYVKDKP